MKHYERKRIKVYASKNNSMFGHIELDHLAKPETVEVSLRGITIIPERFNIFGEPIFTQEQIELYNWAGYSEGRVFQATDHQHKARICYEEREFTVTREEFDTVESIRQSFCNLSSFNELLKNRRIWRKINERDGTLNEFVIFGKYRLDAFGQIWRIHNVELIGNPNIPDVCTLGYFSKVTKSFSTTTGAYIPEERDKCPCCGKEFTIDDLKNSTFDMLNGKVCHNFCMKEYYRRKEIHNITKGLVDNVYKNCPEYDLLPNEYCQEECCNHIPWFMFHTQDGDIKIGSRKRVICIQWQENFKPFDMTIFNDENTTKWCGEHYILGTVQEGKMPSRGIREIHARGYDDAIKYLKKVDETLHPNKK